MDSVETSQSIYDLSVDDNKLFYMDQTRTLIISELSDIGNPVTTHSLGFGSLRNIIVKDGNAYITDALGGLRIYDVSNLAIPIVEKGFYNGEGWANDLKISGNAAFLANSFAGISIVKIDDPENPTLFTSFPTGAHMEDVKVHDGVCYIANGTDGLATIDVSNPLNPVELDKFPVDGWAQGLSLNGNYTYVLDEVAIMTAFDVSDPEDITFVGKNYITGRGEKMQQSGNYGYIAKYSRGWGIVDLNSPENPVELFDSDMDGYVMDVAGIGNYAYVLNSRPKIYIYDVTDKSTPVLVDSLKTSGTPNQIIVEGDNAFVAQSGSVGGVKIFDISDPASPDSVAFLPVFNGVQSITVGGNYLYLASGYNGLRVANISNISNPSFVGYYDNIEYATRIDCDENYIYMIDNKAGLYIFKNDLITGVNSSRIKLNSFTLDQNYPNPFNPVTTIKYSIPVGARGIVPVQLRAYNLLGQEVATLVNENQITGNYQVKFDAGALASGVYLYKLKAGEYTAVKKLMILK